MNTHIDHEESETLGIAPSILMVLIGLIIAITPALMQLWLLFAHD